MTKKKYKKPAKPRPRSKMHTFKLGQEVYLVAYLKVDKTKFYVCRAIIDKIPAQGERQIYRVRIIAVADRAVGGEYVVKQASLLGKIIVKRHNELNYEIPQFLQPPSWIEKDDVLSTQVTSPETKKKTHGKAQGTGSKTNIPV